MFLITHVAQLSGVVHASCPFDPCGNKVHVLTEIGYKLQAYSPPDQQARSLWRERQPGAQLPI